MGPFNNLMSLYGNLVTGAVSLERVNFLWQAPIDVVERPNAITLDEVQGDVVFEDVHFRHTDKPVLEGVSFRLAPGSFNVLLGPSGAGKSTIADLMVRFQDPQAGTIRLDGHDIRDLKLSGLRHKVALVEQTPFLFHASVLENLKYGKPDATAAEIDEVVRASALTDYVASLPEGLATVVGERGLALSAGERQRLALARALLRSPAVFILDEPTSALDPENERAIQQTFISALRGRTTIVITHRESFAALAQQTLILSAGRITQSVTS